MRVRLDTPALPFGEAPAGAPGELTQIDSTALDVLVRLDDGIAEKVEPTALVDIATRSITAAVLHAGHPEDDHTHGHTSARARLPATRVASISSRAPVKSMRRAASDGSAS